MTAQWHFVKHQDGMPVSNSANSELLNESDDDWKFGEVLVRECIQNSIDAHAEEEVCVSFQVRDAASMSAETARFWFGSLWPHLRSKDCNFVDVAPQPQSGGFVVVEDFGTHGLEGDTRQGGLSDADNRFFNFFRAEGLSGNPADGTTGGSWGIGKSVFNRCSRINSFLALSVRRAEGDAVLIGKSILRHHRVTQDDEYQATGQFGVKTSPGEYMVLPETDPALLDRFARDFRVTRPFNQGGGAPGLSVVIPFADPKITAEGIVDIVVREYFHPILTGRLRVRVTGGRAGGQTVVEINADTIMEYAERLKRPEVRRVLDLARWSLGNGLREAYVLDEPPKDERPSWDDALLRADDPRYQDLCQRFEKGEPVAIRVPLRVRPRDAQPQRAAFTVYLQRDMIGTGYRPVFVRGWIVVPNARKHAVRGQNLFALTTIDEGPLAVMLRAAEPPSHTEWSHDTANFKGRYEFGDDVIKFVVGAPKFLADALSSAKTGRDFDVWADLFPAPTGSGQRPGQGTGRKGRTRSPGPIEPPKPRPKPFRIDEVSSGGFIVVRDNAASTPLPERLEVKVAYDTFRGSPFGKYDPADFRLERLTRSLGDADEVECADNRLVIRPTSDHFRLEVTGLDVNRDLVVKVKSAEPTDGDEA